MSIRDQAYSDFKSIIDLDNDDLTLIAPDGTEYELKGMIVRRDAQKDPATNVQFNSPMLAVTVPRKDLAAVPAPYTWQVITDDSTGEQLHYRVAEVRIDRTIGQVTMILEDQVLPEAGSE